jgi:hypothetical protein
MLKGQRQKRVAASFEKQAWPLAVIDSLKGIAMRPHVLIQRVVVLMLAFLVIGSLAHTTAATVFAAPEVPESGLEPMKEPIREEPPMQVRFTVFLPMALTDSTKSSCLSGEDAKTLGDLLVNDAGQRRAVLRCNPLLAQVAKERAEDMAARNYYDHVNPDGFGPNFLVRAAGYPLPGNYSSNPASNNIESIGAGNQNAASMWSSFLASPAHRAHLLGEISFYQEQIEYGVGYAYAEGSAYTHYWVIITAKPAEPVSQ